MLDESLKKLVEALTELYYDHDLNEFEVMEIVKKELERIYIPLF